MTTRLRDWVLPGVIVTAVCVVAVLVGAAFLGKTVRNAGGPDATTPSPAYTIDGSVRLAAGDFTTAGRGCASTRADIHPGAQVMVVDGTGATLTYASLGATVLADDGRCMLPFTLTIPAGRGEYGIDLAGYGQLRYPEAELRDLVELTID